MQDVSGCSCSDRLEPEFLSFFSFPRLSVVVVVVVVVAAAAVAPLERRSAEKKKKKTTNARFLVASLCTKTSTRKKTLFVLHFPHSLSLSLSHSMYVCVCVPPIRT